MKENNENKSPFKMIRRKLETKGLKCTAMSMGPHGGLRMFASSPCKTLGIFSKSMPDVITSSSIYLLNQEIVPQPVAFLSKKQKLLLELNSFSSILL